MSSLVPLLPRRLASALSGIVLLGGLYASGIRFRVSELAARPDVASLDHALLLDPQNSALWLRRADLLDQAGTSGADSLRRAGELNPQDAAVWIRSGLDAEARLEFREAERALLEAARVSRLYEPRWTLVNYYFRRGARDDFWKWAYSALELQPRDAPSLFGLCWRMSQDGEEIRRRAIPQRPSVMRQYVRFLLNENHLPEAASAAQSVPHDASIENVDVLLEASDVFAKHGMAEAALDSWNPVCTQRQQDCEVLQPSQGMKLAETSVQSVAHGRGFAWRTAAASGTTTTVGPGMMAVYFSGQQPEDTDALWRYLPVTAGKRYGFSFEARTTGMPAHSGVRWQVTTVDGGRTTELARSAELSSADWKREVQTFEIPAGVRLVTLALHYKRTPGEVRVDGSAVTRGMELAVVQ